MKLLTPKVLRLIIILILALLFVNIVRRMIQLEHMDDGMEDGMEDDGEDNIDSTCAESYLQTENGDCLPEGDYQKFWDNAPSGYESGSLKNWWSNCWNTNDNTIKIGWNAGGSDLEPTDISVFEDTAAYEDNCKKDEEGNFNKACKKALCNTPTDDPIKGYGGFGCPDGSAPIDNSPSGCKKATDF